MIKDTFSPQNILKEMDLSSGSLNLAGVEIMRKVEGLMKRKKGIILSSSQIQRVGAMLSAYADELIPFESFETPTGEGIKFDFMTMTKLLLYTYALNEIAKVRRIALSLASDGAKVTNSIQHVVCGV